jgi:RNA-binding protein
MSISIDTSSPTLSSRQKKYLKGLGHSLDANIQIGKEGITERLIAATDVELTRHELVKVRIGTNSSVEKRAASEQLSTATGSALVQLLGKTILLFRRSPDLPEDKKLVLPVG